MCLETRQSPVPRRAASCRAARRRCYRRFAQKWEAIRGNEKFHLGAADHVVFHSPYNKLIKKSGARMLYNDWIRDPQLPIFKKAAESLDKAPSPPQLPPSQPAPLQPVPPGPRDRPCAGEQLRPSHCETSARVALSPPCAFLPRRCAAA